MKRKNTKWALWVLYTVLATAVLRDFIANDCPLYCKIDDQSYFPAFRTLSKSPHKVLWPSPLDSIYRNGLWAEFPYQEVLFAPVPFRAGQSNSRAIEKPPLYKQDYGRRGLTHWLGTDRDGRDVAAGMVAGARVAVLSGVLVMAISGLLGVFLGGIAGYFGDTRLRVSRIRLWLNLFALPVACFFAFFVLKFHLTEVGGWKNWGKSMGIWIGILVLANLLAGLLKKSSWFSKKSTIPADLLIMRLAELFHALPKLLLIVSIAAILSVSAPSIWVLIAVVAACSWMGIAQLLRSELLRVRELDYVQSARAMGFSDFRILFRHALPNAMRPVLTAFAIGMAGAVMLEASLSFLGFSGGDASASWGSLLNSARGHYSMWWLAVFPGLAVFAVILSLNVLADDMAAE